MCNFISAVKRGEDYFYLTKDDLRGRRFAEFKKKNAVWYEDIKGHGAIEFFYPELKGEHWECEDFSTPDNFPPCIVKDIKRGAFKGIGVCPDILNKEGMVEYEKVRQSAWEEYYKVKQLAREEYYEV